MNTTTAVRSHRDVFQEQLLMEVTDGVAEGCIGHLQLR